ncbi:hypothetical protein E2562_020690 [Oryza meyeriana var. granulata]|uniref:DNA/RNA-binding domain-containing protein n=1 Tax=Oryza meyeriana var. granulata TaxID=110450 RepID=A0A6G1EN04_9ORYZ|nr:hypothetical protein E2562_020690 [Oryza meyeriana var. granulata]KAF0926006.1 hypothetical protein E2562_020690 [Oryza meyeriana var. granulata]
MTVPMDKAAASPLLGELAQRLWKKKYQEEPLITLNMKVICEGHEIEHLLWKIHYKRIEEFRTHVISAGKNNINPDRTKRIRSTFRSFLSEATGFYHDLILKIRSTYVLPFGYFSEGSDSSAVSGDLTRYKGLYGDADYASREYAAASIYYNLETFGELSATVISDLQILLSFGPHEELNFDVEAAENALSVVKLVAILISTVHNANKDADNQSFAEIVQRRVVLQKAFTTAFEFVGYLLKRCVELHDIASSIYLPAILVFIEWLACHPDFVACSEMDEEQAGARSFFWNQFVPFTNKLILTGLARFDGDDDETCFFDMGTYEGGETGNRLALSEDFELRGFSPLVPAQVILDFSNKRVFGSDGSTKEKKARVERILAAGKALINFVKIDQLRIYFHSSSKKFLMASEPPCSESAVPHIGSANANTTNHIEQEHVASSTIGSINLSVVKSKEQYYAEGDDDEEIVFKPSLSEKLLGVPLEKTSRDFLQPVQISDASWSYNGASVTFQSNAPVPTSTTYVQSLPVSSIGWAAEHQVKPSIGTRSIAEFF